MVGEQVVRGVHGHRCGGRRGGTGHKTQKGVKKKVTAGLNSLHLIIRNSQLSFCELIFLLLFRG
jgi:hypothetical protein